VDASDNLLCSQHILEQFSRLRRLSTLTLACNRICSLVLQSDSVPRGLVELDLSYNRLKGDVMTPLAHLPRLTFLDLSSNYISFVPAESCMCGFRNLEALRLDSNALSQLTVWKALGLLSKLRVLSLASNQIQQLESGILAADGRFPALLMLDLSSNEIGEADDLAGLQEFQTLKLLDLSSDPCAAQSHAVQSSWSQFNINFRSAKSFFAQYTRHFRKCDALGLDYPKLDARLAQEQPKHKQICLHRIVRPRTRHLKTFSKLGADTCEPLGRARANSWLIGTHIGKHSSESASTDFANELNDQEFEVALQARHIAVHNAHAALAALQMPPTEATQSVVSVGSKKFARFRAEESGIDDSISATESSMRTGTFLTVIGEESVLDSNSQWPTIPARETQMPTSEMSITSPPPVGMNPGTAPSIPMSTTPSLVLPPIDPALQHSTAKDGYHDPMEALLRDPNRERLMPNTAGVREAMKALRIASMLNFPHKRY